MGAILISERGLAMDKRPNLLLFMTDHQRNDVIGMVQCGREVTPNLNRLAEEGVRFQRAYDTCPLCVPARTALATGLYPTENGVVYNDWKGSTAGNHEPIHKTLQKAGYRVGHVGVDHIRVQPPMREQGLDFFISQEDYEIWAAAQGVVTKRSEEQLTSVEEEIEGSYVRRLYSGHQVALWNKPIEQFKDYYFKEKALEFLKEKTEEPFALFVYLWAPHPPFKVPEPYYSMYDPQQVVLPDHIGVAAEGEPALRRKGVPAQLARGISREEWKKAWAAHLGLTTMADEFFGKILAELKKQECYDRTCILFTSDHGENLGQHNMYQKMEMYEEAVRVPFVIKVPGERQGMVREVISHLDIRPTFCELAELDPGEGDGVSLLSAVRSGKGDEKRIVYAQYSGNPGYGTVRRAAISGRYKYVYDSSYEHELYDLMKDPQEMHNVAGKAEYQDALQMMHTVCRNYHEKRGDYFTWSEQNAAVGTGQKMH